MGYEPTVKCRCCDEPLDVYQPFEDRFCSNDCRVTEAEYQANVNNGNIGRAAEVLNADWPERNQTK